MLGRLPTLAAVELAFGGARAEPERLTVDVEHRDDETDWSVANDTATPVAVERVQLVWRVRANGPLRAFLHGWQSWSACHGTVVGDHEDPSRRGDPGLVRAMHHADDAVAGAGEARSELVTALADDDSALGAGFDGGAGHDGTFRLRDRGHELVAEAFLGGAVLGPGERRRLHTVRIEHGDPGPALERWAAWAGTRSGARTGGPYITGWCSWYHYFHDVSEAALRDNLARAGDFGFEVFQLDDGYQAAIGDWLDRAPAFSSPLETLAADIAAAGHRPGLWLAPFLVSPSSTLARARPDWIVRRPSGRPMVGMVNPGWGGEQHVLDTTHPEVLDHLERLARTLVAMGWSYLKLDFTYAPSFTGRWHDPTRTPAQRVRAGYDAIRRGAGDATFLLGCGAPLGPCVGAVDGMRIGPDVAPHWEPRSPFAAYADTVPATANALRNTRARSFLHRRLWINDPDCLMLRRDATELTPAQIEAWSDAVAASGGMALVSDDLALLGGDAAARFDDVVTVGRAVDEAAAAGHGPEWSSAAMGPR